MRRNLLVCDKKSANKGENAKVIHTV